MSRISEASLVRARETGVDERGGEGEIEKAVAESYGGALYNGYGYVLGVACRTDDDQQPGNLMKAHIATDLLYS